MVLVRNYMRAPPQVDKDRPLSYVLDLMEDLGVSCIAVTDEKRLIGLITLRNVLERIWSERVRLMSFSSLYASSVMSINLRTTSPDADIYEAAKFIALGDVCGVPVVDDGGDLVGLVTEEDLIKFYLDKSFPVRIIPSSDFVALKPDDRVLHARATMIESGLQALPVLNNDGRLVGLVSDWDLIKALRLFHERTPEKHRRRRIKFLFVSDAMRRAPPHVLEDSTVGEAAKLIIENQLRGLVVTDFKGDLKSVVQLRDFIKFLALGGA